jgi:hypothetical protein
MDFLNECPKKFIIERYSKLLIEKEEAKHSAKLACDEVKRLKKVIHDLKKELSAVKGEAFVGADDVCEPVAPTHCENNSTFAITEKNCTICLEEMDDNRPLTTLTCKHRFHFECIALSFSAKGKMICPLCRNQEPGTWQFDFTPRNWDDKPTAEEIARQEREDMYYYTNEEEQAMREFEEARRERQLSIIDELSRRTVGVVRMNNSNRNQHSRNINHNHQRRQHDRSNLSQNHSRSNDDMEDDTREPTAAILVPVPAVPVDSLTELRAVTTGSKRTIYFPFAC